MTTWSDILTTALLGTGRRPLPAEPPTWAVGAGLIAGGDVEGRVLDLAAAHRVAAQAGRPAQSWAGPTAGPAAGSAAGPTTGPTAGPTAAPEQRLPLAPPAARRLLDGVLVRPDAAMVDLWLAACRRHGCGLAPEHWAQVVALASRSATYDREGLASVLGERGRWFVAQNPEWRKLSRQLDAAQLDDSRSGPERADVVLNRLPTTEQIEKDPERLTSVAEPWPDTLVAAAVAGIVSAPTGSRPRSFARMLGSRLTQAQYASLGILAQRLLELPHLSPSARRDVRNLFVQIERAAADRTEIERAFDPSLERIVKVTIPPV